MLQRDREGRLSARSQTRAGCSNVSPRELYERRRLVTKESASQDAKARARSGEPEEAVNWIRPVSRTPATSSEYGSGGRPGSNCLATSKGHSFVCGWSAECDVCAGSTVDDEWNNTGPASRNGRADAAMAKRPQATMNTAKTPTRRRVFVVVIFRMREQRLTTPSSATAEHGAAPAWRVERRRWKQVP